MIVGKIRGKDEYHFSRKEIDVSIGGCGGWFNPSHTILKTKIK
jgi:hypothetical protein